MATPFAFPVTAAQIGTYFVGQYYHLLQQQPDYVHQFYTDASTMLRIDGNTRETASAMLQIHTLIMSLSYTGIEIRTVHALESWNGGVLVMVSGAVQLKDFSGRKKFVQTFFLAPQEKGFFVLNDVFHYIEDDQIQHHPATLMVQGNLDAKLNASVTNSEPVPNYLRSAEIQSRNLSNPAVVQENGSADAYDFSEQRLQHGAERENNMEDKSVKDTNSLHTEQDPPPPPPPVEEPLGEPQKHTYASILRVAKGHSAPSASPQPSLTQINPSASERQHAPQSTAQQSSSTALESSLGDTADEAPVTEEGEIKSVYVRNLPPNVSTSEIEEQFRNFGKIKPDGVVIRSRKDVGVCYAFIEFEDMTGVENAVKSSTAQVAGRQVYIEERRANSNIPSRGGRRGRGRGGYQTEAPRGRFGARFGRGGTQDGRDRGYRQRGNGFYRQVPRQERDFPRNQASRNGHNPSEEAVA